jgi:hypothetical protein
MKNKNKSYPLYPPIPDLIQMTLSEIREGSPAGRNPLEGALEAYRLRLQGFPREQLGLTRNELMKRIMQEDDLSTRFVLKLMHDVTEAVLEGRRPAYLMTTLIR